MAHRSWPLSRPWLADANNPCHLHDTMCKLLGRAVDATNLYQQCSKDTILTLIGGNIRSLLFAGTKYRMFGSMSSLCSCSSGSKGWERIPRLCYAIFGTLQGHSVFAWARQFHIYWRKYTYLLSLTSRSAMVTQCLKLWRNTTGR
jgi:hypothetical protein